MSNLISIDNSEFFQLFLQAGDPLKTNVFSTLSKRDLSNFRAVCKLFWSFIEGDVAFKDRLALPRWASEQIVYVNRGFLNSGDMRLIQDSTVSNDFTMRTILRLAKWLANKGNTPIPPHGLKTFQPRELLPAEYVNGIDHSGRIYFHLWKLHDSPPDIDDQYGEKAFHDLEGFQSTPGDKARACEAYVRDEMLGNG